MKVDKVLILYKKILKQKINEGNLNKYVKGVVINFGDKRGDIVVMNDNFNTRRKYMDFTEGKKKANIHPFQIIFTNLEMEAFFKTKYVDENNEIKEFEDLYECMKER